MKIIFKYLPGALINIGNWIFTYNMLRPHTTIGGLPSVATRRLLEYKKLQKQTVHNQ